MNEIEMLDYIWSRFHAHLLSEVEKTSQSDVAKRLNVGKAQISRWISESQRGGNLNTIIKAVCRLNMDWGDLVPGENVISEFDEALGRILSGIAGGLQISEAEIAQQLSGKVSSQKITSILQGKAHVSAEELFLVCQTLGCSADKVFTQANKIVNEGKASEIAV